MFSIHHKPPVNIPREEVHDTVNRLVHNLTTLKDHTGEFLLRLNDGSVCDTKSWNDWEWTQGVGLYGLWQLYTLTNNPDTLKIIETWFHERLFVEKSRHKNINTMAAMLTLACVYERHGNPAYLPHLNAWAEWAMYDLERTKYGGMQHITYVSPNDQQLWDDTLMMTVLPLAKIGKVLNRPHYVEEAKRQFLIHIKYLFDTKTGLFFHGWCFNDGGHNFAEALWGRGNSWITIVIPEFLDLVQLAENDPIRIHLIDTLDAQVKALAKYQDKQTGLWRTIIDDETAYVEASASAGFAFGIMKSVRKRFLDKSYLEIGLQGAEAVLKCVDKESGELTQVSFGTPMGDTKQFYKDIPLTSMPYGQAMGIMCLVELLHHYL